MPVKIKEHSKDLKTWEKKNKNSWIFSVNFKENTTFESKLTNAITLYDKRFIA